MSHSVMTEYLYFYVGMYITTYFRTLTPVLYICLAYIRDCTIALRMYVAVVSPYPWDRDAIIWVLFLSPKGSVKFLNL